MTDKGMLVQWWPITTQSLPVSRSMVRSMLDSFDHLNLWSTDLHEMLLIGSQHPIEVNERRIDKWLTHTPLKQALSEVGIENTAGLLATYMMGTEQLQAFAKDALPVTDNFLRLEYDPWVSKKIILKILPELIAEQQIFSGLSPGLESKYLLKREKLRAFYYAGLASYSGGKDVWRETLQRLYRADKTNAYYQWFRE